MSIRNPSAAGGVIDPLSALGEVRAYRDGAEVCSQGGSADCVYRVVSGVVRTSRLTEDGRRQIGDFHFAGDLLALDDGEQHAFTAEALGACEVLVIRRRTLEAQAGQDITVAQALWRASAERLRKMQGHLIQLGRKTAIERVAAVLAQFAEQVERDVIDLPMSRQDLADYLGLTIETVSRMISQLQASKVIRLTTLRQMRICDPQALRQLAA
ncbi:helix-turn-helix domain-containing protein [Brevundimonas sp.]|uniref:helix-turn-helix domain-containing protein n=1 Tax=Brevundimonas sp. TaxID=1871086 RepID=UPI0025EAB646|nr:helix-turn-helix domain-containing protein [Brevundimonas sp.]